jgi:hypothetical protein
MKMTQLPNCVVRRAVDEAVARHARRSSGQLDYLGPGSELSRSRCPERLGDRGEAIFYDEEKTGKTLFHRSGFEQLMIWAKSKPSVRIHPVRRRLANESEHGGCSEDR